MGHISFTFPHASKIRKLDEIGKFVCSEVLDFFYSKNSFQGYILHRRMKYISMGSCSIYPFSGGIFLHGLFCRLNVRAMRSWPPLMMQASLGFSRLWGFSISPWYSSGIIRGSFSFSKGRRFGFRPGTAGWRFFCVLCGEISCLNGYFLLVRNREE